MRLSPSRFVHVTSLFAALTGCGHTAPGEPAPATTSASASSAAERSSDALLVSTSGSGGSQAGASATPAAAPAPGRMFYALGLHPERAELFRGDTRVLDFGEASGAQYTLGGWLTGTGADHGFGEERALLGLGKVLKIALPIEAAGSHRLSLRVRGFAATTLSIHVNGDPVADVALDGKSFQVIDKVVPAEQLKVGENLLQLRVARTGASPRGGDASFALDWIRIGPAEAAHDGARPPALAELAAPVASTPALHLTAGDRLAYGFEVPAGAELRASLAAQDGARLSVVAERDGKPPETLLTTKAAKETVRVPLGRFAHELVRLSLRAEGGKLALLSPEVVVVDSAAFPKGAGGAQPKNVIIVLIDTLRADKLSAYTPGSRVKTPGLTTFLQGAAVMQNARTQENWTKPSVATLLSSLLPWQHNAVTGDAKVPASVEMLPELLQDRGYYTGAFIANGYVSDKFGFKQGWNTYRNYIREGRRTIAQEVAADVVEWLDKRPKDKPFFMYVHTIDPHVPYKPPKSFLELYDPDPYSGPVDFSRTNELLEKIKIGSMKLNARDKVRLEALYDGEISYHDVHFAATLRALEERGLDKDTVIVVTADHGEEFWDHGSVGHGHSVYDELLHIPMILRIPGITEGKQVLPDAVGLVDVMPTILDAIGQEKPSDLVGASFLPELKGEGTTAPRTAVSGFMQSWRTLGVGGLKLLQRAPENMWLYDVKADPGETKDIAKDRPLALRYARSMLGITIAEGDNGKRYGGGAAAPAKAAPAKRQHKEEKTDIDPETEKQLRALGYVGSSAK